MGWNFETGKWEDEESTVAPKATTPSAATPKPAVKKPAPKKDDGWSGGLWSDLKHVATRSKENAGEVVRSLTQLPGALSNEVADAAAFLTGGYSDKALQAVENADPTAGGLGKWAPATTEERQQSEGPKTVEDVNLANLGEVPIVRLVPGMYSASKVAKGEAGDLAENPVVTALDLLPYAGKAGKVLTKPGGKLGALGESAAGRADVIGRVAKADRIREKGMKLPEIAQEVTRRAEARLVKKYPGLVGKTPSDLMERAGLGGERLRQSLKMVGSRSRHYVKDVVEEQKRILKGTQEWERQGVSRERQSQLLSESEVADRAWWDQRNDAERGFLTWFRNASDELFQKYDKTFEFGGERYTQAQAPGLYKHWRRMQTIQKWQQAMDARLDPSHPKHPKSPEALANLQKRRDLMDRRLGVVEGKAQEASRTAYPARFSALINERMRPAVSELAEVSRQQMLAEGVELPVSEEMIGKLLEDGHYRELEKLEIISKKDLDRIGKETAETWQDLRDQGFDPMYHHHVVGMRRRRLASPRFDPIHLMKDPSAIKRRGWDMEPWVPEASVSLLDQAVDLIQTKHANHWLDEMRNNGMLKSSKEVADETAGAVDRILANMSPEKRARVNVGEMIDELQKLMYQEFDSSGPFAFRAPKMSGSSEAMYIPKGIAGAIEKIAQPPKLPAAARVPMRAFRVSVLYLNPTYYLGNAIGNAMMMTARGSPADLRFFPKAYKAWRKGELPIDISLGPVLGSADESFKAGLDQMGWQSVDDLDKNVWSKTADRIGHAERFLQRFAGALDDMSKATAYFAEHSRAVKGGADADLAIARAVEHMNKVNMGFDTLSPMERAVMRGVMMPFYSWSKFALGYIMSYPFDHPFRAAVLSSLSRQVREEWDERLPERLMGYYPVGTTKDGKTKLYPASGIYPFLSFSSTTDIWTGVARRMSPIFQVAQEVMGLDPFSGSPDPYVSYNEDKWTVDPVSGRPKYVRPGVGRLLAENYLPQAELLFNHFDPKQQEYYRKNPGRWFETVMQSLGVPHYQTRDLGEEADKYAKVQKRFGAEEPTQVAPAPSPTPAASGTAGGWNFETGRWEE